MIWLPVPGFPNYEISATCSIRRVPHETIYTTASGITRRRTFDGRPVKTSVSNHGYQVVRLVRDGKPQLVMVHRILLWAHGGPPPFPGAIALHINDVKLDNRLNNLRWGSYRDNWHDAQRNGIAVVGLRPDVCRRGHEFTPKNTYTAKNGQRMCRECQRFRDRRRRMAQSISG